MRLSLLDFVFSDTSGIPVPAVTRALAETAIRVGVFRVAPTAQGGLQR